MHYFPLCLFIKPDSSYKIWLPFPAMGKIREWEWALGSPPSACHPLCPRLDQPYFCSIWKDSCRFCSCRLQYQVHLTKHFLTIYSNVLLSILSELFSSYVNLWLILPIIPAEHRLFSWLSSPGFGH